MKRLLRDTCIILAQITGISWVYRARLRTKGPLVRVVVFHDVQDVKWFARTITTLCAHNHMLTPEEFTSGNFDTQRINILITFDDGYASWVDVCLPILAEHKMKALFFLNSGLLDVHDDAVAQEAYVREQLLLKPRKTLSWEGARALSRAGHTVGGHTRSHRRLSELPIAIQEAEIKDDKARLTEMLGTSITTFAYPFGNHGDYTRDTERLVLGAGYTHAFTTNGTFADTCTPYTLSRLCIEDNLSPHMLSLEIAGGYDILMLIKERCYETNTQR